jgi:hypothetical protein
MIGLFLLLFAPPTVTAKAVPESIRLSDTTTVTLTVEGDAPIAAMTGDWLADESAMSWQIKQIGQALVTPLPNGRERWLLELLVEPDVPGKQVPLQFRPQSFRFGSNASPQMVEWPALSVEVTTQAKAVADDARLITGIEAVPDPPPWNWRPVVVIAANIFLFAIGLALLLRRDFRRSRPVSTGDWLTQQLTSLEAEPNPLRQAAAIAKLLRGYVARKYGLVTDCRTTAETEAEVLAAANIPPTFDRMEFAKLLHDCDRVKFDPAATSNRSDLLVRCRAWIGNESTPTDAGNRS